MPDVRCAVVVVVGIGLIGCGGGPVRTPNPAESVTGVSVVPSSVVMNTGDKVTLKAMVSAGPGQSNLRVRWTSSNAAVASVDSNGVVSSAGGGVTTITATSLADSRFSGNCVVTVSLPFGTVTIAAIKDDGRAADLSNVSGNVDVIVNVDNQATSVLRVDALLSGEKGDTAVASYAPGDSPAQTSVGPTALSFNTLGLKNGAYVLKVRVALRNGTTVTSASVQLTIRNP